MGLIIEVTGADWSGRGYPLANGFVANDNLLAGFDFRLRNDRLTDVSGRGFTATPYRNNINGAALVEDATVLENASGGQGIIVRNGMLDLKLSNREFPVNGSTHFTTMIVGGYSGIPFDSGQPGGTPIICNLVDMGNGVSAGDSPPVLQQYRVDTSLGARIRATAASNIGAAAGLGIKTCFFVTYDGLKVTYKNMSTGALVERTNAQLGIVGTSLKPAANCPTLRSGNYLVGTSAAIGLYPELYQVAQWDKVLTADEMQAQYLSSKSLFPSIGI